MNKRLLLILLAVIVSAGICLDLQTVSASGSAKIKEFEPSQLIAPPPIPPNHRPARRPAPIMPRHPYPHIHGSNHPRGYYGPPPTPRRRFGPSQHW